MGIRKSSFVNRFYAAYRKIRFLAKTGSLFSGSRAGRSGEVSLSGNVFRIISLNSLILFLIGYIIVYTLNLFITGFAAIIFNIPVLVYYYDVDFLVRGIDWTYDSVTGVFSSGPLAMLVLSVFLLLLYKAVETETGILRLLLLWMIFHTLTRFFGEILVGSVMGKGFGFVILYLFVMDTGKLILTILSCVAMFTIGLFMTRMSLYSANIYFNDLLGSYRRKFIYYQFLIPFFIGNILILLLKIPHFNYYDASLNASMILLLIPILVRSFSMQDLYFDEDERSIKPSSILLVSAICLLITFRVILGFGVRL